MTPRVLTALVSIVIFTALLQLEARGNYEISVSSHSQDNKHRDRINWDIYGFLLRVLHNVFVIVGGAFAGNYIIPALLTAIGFGPAGIIAGSIAAFIQTPFTASGSLFAILQSIGARGIAGFFGSIIGGIGGLLSNLIYNTNVDFSIILNQVYSLLRIPLDIMTSALLNSIIFVPEFIVGKSMANFIKDAFSFADSSFVILQKVGASGFLGTIIGSIFGSA